MQTVKTSHNIRYLIECFHLMPIEFEKGRGECHDCGGQLEGGFIINVFDFGMVTPVGMASGELIEGCAEHHDTNRQWGEEKDLPQHDTFDVSSGEKEIGELGSVSSMASEAKFWIKDKETYQKFAEEIRRFQEAHRRRWG